MLSADTFGVQTSPCLDRVQTCLGEVWTPNPESYHGRVYTFVGVYTFEGSNYRSKERYTERESVGPKRSRRSRHGLLTALHAFGIRVQTGVTKVWTPVWTRARSRHRSAAEVRQ